MDKYAIILLSGILIIVFALVMAVFVRNFTDFSQELSYINEEINRTTGEEQKHWRRRRRRLWLSLIPFIKYE